jgi:hypothetical protein
MKSILKSLLLLPLLALLITSCNNFGKKVSVAGSKGEVYYKGEGVTESDAKTLGAYLKDDLKYFNDSIVSSVQLLKAATGGYDVRFVVDKEKLKTVANSDAIFESFGSAMSIDLYKNQPVNIFLADESMKDIKSLPFNKKAAEEMMAKIEADKNPQTSDNPLEGYDKQVAEGITFYWKDPVTDADAETIGKAIIKTGAFSGGDGKTVNVIMEKDGDRYLVKFPVAEGYRTDAAYLATIETVAKQIKDAAFANSPYSFVMTDEMLNPVKSWDY